MRTPIQLFILGILCILAYPVLLFELPIRNKINHGEIEYEYPDLREISFVEIPANVRYISSRGVDLLIYVDSIELSSYESNNSCRFRLEGDTLVIEELIKNSEPGLIENTSQDPESKRSNVRIYMAGLNGWNGIHSSLDLVFYSYEIGKSYSIQSAFGSSLSINLRPFNGKTSMVSEQPFDADFQIQLDHVINKYQHNIKSRNASFKLIHSNLELSRNDFAKTNQVEADGSSNVVLPQCMIPKVIVKYMK